MRRLAWILIAMSMLFSVIGVAGCQNLVGSATKAGIEKATGVTTKGDSVTIKKDGQSLTVGSTDAGKLPAGFPSDFPMYDPLTIANGVKAETNGKVVFTVTAKSASAQLEEIKKFYADKLTAQGWAVKESGTVTNGVGVGTVEATKGAEKATIQLVQANSNGGVDLIMLIEQK